MNLIRLKKKLQDGILEIQEQIDDITPTKCDHATCGLCIQENIEKDKLREQLKAKLAEKQEVLISIDSE